MNVKITSYKMFDTNFKCRDFQYAAGESYVTDKVEACSLGFHACEFPLDCFSYYNPANSKFAEVVQSGEISTHSDDTKVASTEIYINVELSLHQFVGKAVDWIYSKIDWENSKESNTGDRSAASNTGDQSAATNTGYRSAATNTGNYSVATNTGIRSAATNTGNQSVATNTGYRSAATNTGNQSVATNTGIRSAATNTGNYSVATNTGYRSAATNTGARSAATVSGGQSVAISTGRQGRAKASLGSAIVLVFRDDNYNIVHIKAGIAGKDIEPDTFYSLDENGNFVKVEE